MRNVSRPCQFLQESHDKAEASTRGSAAADVQIMAELPEQPRTGSMLGSSLLERSEDPTVVVVIWIESYHDEVVFEDAIRHVKRGKCQLQSAYIVASFYARKITGPYLQYLHGQVPLCDLGLYSTRYVSIPAKMITKLLGLYKMSC